MRATGSSAPARYGGDRRPLLGPYPAELRTLVERTPDITLAELQAELHRRRVSWPHAQPSITHSAGSACGTKKSLRAAEQDQPDVAAKRLRWRAWQRFMDPARFVFLDQTGAATTIARRYGRNPKSQRLVAAVPHRHWRTTTLVAGLRQTGIVAPLVLDGPMTVRPFAPEPASAQAGVKQFLAPSL